jgi:hypothetical protein
VGRPAGSERLADLGGFEFVGRGIFEERAREVGRRVDGQLDPVGARCARIVELAGRESVLNQCPEAHGNAPNDALLFVLPAVRKLSQAVLVDVVDLLADGTSRQLGVVGGDHHAAMSFATHGCSEGKLCAAM